MRWIVSRSLRFRWLVLFAAAAMMVLGVSQIPNAKVDVFPEFAPPQVEIQTIALGNSSTEVEELITVPIEEQLQGIDGVDELRSKSVSQLSAIRIIFKRRHGRAAGPPARDRARRAGHADAADLGSPAVDHAAALGDQPDHEDRPHLQGAEPDRDVVDRLLEGAPAHPARAGRRAGQHLRRAPRPAPRAGRPGEARQERRLARRGDEDDLRGGRRRRAPVRGQLRRRHRRLRGGRTASA